MHYPIRSRLCLFCNQCHDLSGSRKTANISPKIIHWFHVTIFVCIFGQVLSMWSFKTLEGCLIEHVQLIGQIWYYNLSTFSGLSRVNIHCFTASWIGLVIVGFKLLNVALIGVKPFPFWNIALTCMLMVSTLVNP